MSSSPFDSGQRPLDIVLRPHATFDTFVSPTEHELVPSLKGLAQAASEPRHYFLWGRSQSGKSHLLQAVCNYLARAELRTVFLPMRELGASGPDLLQDLQLLDVVCIDDIDCVPGVQDWEQALFRIVNDMWLGNKALVVSAACKPADLDIGLADLASRLAGGLVYRLSSLTDEQKKLAIRLHAQARGLEVSPEVCSYLLRRYPRELKTLVEIIDKLDNYSLALQRKITVPFVRSVLAGS